MPLADVHSHVLLEVFTARSLERALGSAQTRSSVNEGSETVRWLDVPVSRPQLCADPATSICKARFVSNEEALLALPKPQGRSTALTILCFSLPRLQGVRTQGPCSGVLQSFL